MHVARCLDKTMAHKLQHRRYNRRDIFLLLVSVSIFAKLFLDLDLDLTPNSDTFREMDHRSNPVFIESYNARAKPYVTTDNSGCGRQKYFHLNDAIPKHVIKMYWINLDKSETRRHSMNYVLSQQKFGWLNNTRVPAVDGPEISRMVAQNELVHTIKIKTKTEYDYDFGTYTIGEVGCLISHFRSIKMAIQDGVEIALITEDDISIGSDFLQKVDQIIDTAPSDWEIIQLVHRQATLHVKLMSIHSDFLSWRPRYISTGAYLINRKGMKKIRRNFFPDLTTISISDGNVVVADELLYSTATTYTYTKIVVDLKFRLDTTSTILNQAKDAEKLQHAFQEAKKVCHPKIEPHRDLSLLAVTLMRESDNMTKTLQLIANMKANIQETNRWNVRWIVFIETFSSIGKIKFAQFMNDIKNVDFELVPSDVRKSKWIYYGRLSRMVKVESFRQILFVDSDLNFKGFPIGDFLLRHQNLFKVYEHLVTGAASFSVKEMMTFRYPTDKRPLRNRIFNTWEWDTCGKHLVYGQPLDQLGGDFLMMDPQFVAWFFEKIFTDTSDLKIDSLPLDWPLELVLSGATAEFYEQTRNLGNGKCTDDYQFQYRNYSCGDWNGYGCESFCMNGHCSNLTQLQTLQIGCCSTCSTSPRLLLLPLFIEILGDRFVATKVPSYSWEKKHVGERLYRWYKKSGINRLRRNFVTNEPLSFVLDCPDSDWDNFNNEGIPGLDVVGLLGAWKNYYRPDKWQLDHWTMNRLRHLDYSAIKQMIAEIVPQYS